MLTSQGFPDESVPYAYLVTAPSFLGYSFNPVSFWYLYTAQLELRAMILEVNNTFDERRMYLLKADREQSSEPQESKNGVINGKECSEETPPKQGREKPRAKFSDVWTKDFHVSPFNSRDGSYALVAQDPRPVGTEEDIYISNNITLVSSGGHPKLVARVFSDGDSIDPTALGVGAVLKFIVRWGWVGFLTSPRILKEAWKLFFTHKLQIWYRPEVAQGSIARTPTAAERYAGFDQNSSDWALTIRRILESYFRQYLTHLVECSAVPLSVAYNAAPGITSSCRLDSAHEGLHGPLKDVLEVSISSPAFYSRFIHYDGAAEALDREFSSAEMKNRTILVVNARLLTALYASETKCISELALSESFLTWSDVIRWHLLRRLRCPPTAVAYPKAHEGASQQNDFGAKTFSALDAFVIRYCKDAAQYRRTATELFIAQRWCWGLTFLPTSVDFLIRFFLLKWTLTKVFDMLHTSNVMSVLFRILCVSVIHVWGIAKGT